MQTFENLNKENFWNALMDKYSNAMKVFCDWIDEYKKSVQWDALFGNIFPTEKKIKFHDIPWLCRQVFGFSLFLIAEVANTKSTFLSTRWTRILQSRWNTLKLT